MIQHITLTFEPVDGILDGQNVTARGLHGLLFHLLKIINPQEATRLHVHPTPKPFALVPFYTGDGELAGLRISALTDEVACTLTECWQAARKTGYVLRLGTQQFTVTRVVCTPGPGYATLTAGSPIPELGLRFLSPTSFSQGPGSIPLPVPINVFSWPFRVWQTFAQDIINLPPDWLDWCEMDVFVTGHRIETITANISKKERFTGFVGDVWFEAKTEHPHADLYLRTWHALAGLTAYSGTGHKTTMGMGAVEVLYEKWK